MPLRPALPALLALLLAGCAPAPAAPAATPTPDPKTVVRLVSVIPASAVIAVGGSQDLVARVTYGDGAQDANVRWSADDATVLRVDPATGRVTGLAPGVAAVFATSLVDPERRAAATFTVKAPVE